jgi:NACalpha-BTF3-like transcription factor
MQEHIRIVSYKTIVENADINEAMALANPELANAIRAVKEV